MLIARGQDTVSLVELGPDGAQQAPALPAGSAAGHNSYRNVQSVCCVFHTGDTAFHSHSLPMAAKGMQIGIPMGVVDLSGA
jgi:hypothetical protein